MFSPENFSRLMNPSPEDLERFKVWLFKRTLVNLQAGVGDLPATRAAMIRYFRQGLRADLLLDELMGQLPELLRRVGYPEHLMPRVVDMIKALDLSELGIERTSRGLAFNPESGYARAVVQTNKDVCFKCTASINP